MGFTITYPCDRFYITLKRVGDTTECAMDINTADGEACTLDPEINPIVPERELLCGNLGILYDSVIPLELICCCEVQWLDLRIHPTTTNCEESTSSADD